MQLELFDARPAVASTLPDEGIDLYGELQRYRDWLIAQALVRTQGNRAAAAMLLRVKRTTLVMMLRSKRPLERAETGGMTGTPPVSLELCELGKTSDGDADEGAEHDACGGSRHPEAIQDLAQQQ